MSSDPHNGPEADEITHPFFTHEGLPDAATLEEFDREQTRESARS